MERSKSDYDADRLETIARELGYDGWESVPRILRRNILGSLETGNVRVTDDSLGELIADAVEV